MDDFSSGTSSRSTKLIHGGVRYLQKAFLNLDIEQYRMVKEALHERSNLLQIAPHLSYPLPIMLPVYKYVIPLSIINIYYVKTILRKTRSSDWTFCEISDVCLYDGEVQSSKWNWVLHVLLLLSSFFML